MNQAVVEISSHTAADIIGKASDAEALDSTGHLYDGNDNYIDKGQLQHIPGGSGTVNDVIKTLGQLSFIVRPRQHAYIVDQTGNGNDDKDRYLSFEISADPIGMRKQFIFFHGGSMPPGYAESRLWIRLYCGHRVSAEGHRTAVFHLHPILPPASHNTHFQFPLWRV